MTGSSINAQPTRAEKASPAPVSKASLNRADSWQDRDEEKRLAARINEISRQLTDINTQLKRNEEETQYLVAQRDEAMEAMRQVARAMNRVYKE